MPTSASTSVRSKSVNPSIAMQTAQVTASEQAKAIQARMKETEAQTERLNKLATAFTKAAESGDVDTVKLITADFKEASALAQQIQRDLASKMVALGGGFKDIGFTLEDLQKMNTQEEGVILAAKEMLEPIQ